MTPAVSHLKHLDKQAGIGEVAAEERRTCGTQSVSFASAVITLMIYLEWLMLPILVSSPSY